MRGRRWLIVAIATAGSLAWIACGGADGDAPLPGTEAGADTSTIDSASPDDGATAGDADASEEAAVDGDASVPICVRAVDAGVPDDSCLARLPVAGKNARYYRSHPLDQKNPAITNLVLVQHGNNRNAWDYYDVMAAAARARDPKGTAVIAPHFQASGNACADGPDVIAANDLDYACSDWKDGLLDKSGTVDSYTVLDALLAAAKSAFPGLVRVTIVGYSAGGQTIQRYAGGNKEHARTPAIATRYVIGSPGTYMYLDAQRVKADAVCTNASTCALDATSFEVPAYAPDCNTTDSHVDTNSGAYDDYKYGLANRAGYLASIADVDLVAQYVARPIVYVLSEGDSRRVGVVNARYPSGTPTAYTALDKDCPAIVQAPAESSFRLQRGLVYHRYVTSVFGATHRVVVVPECGHDDACVLGSAQGLAEIFGP